MVKLVAVVNSEDHKYERRQQPFVVDDTITMVAQFDDSCDECSQTALKEDSLEQFVTKFRSLTSDEIAIALMVKSQDIIDLLSQLVPCVGCRKSVERLFNQLVASGHPTLEPLIIMQGSFLSIRRECLFDPKRLFALLYMHGSRLADMMDCIPKSKKNKRCQIHSLDCHKVRKLSSWQENWEMLADNCRVEMTVVKCSSIVETMDNYLRKHRFCADCKSKVQQAYRILVKEVTLDPNNQNGYRASLYHGISFCQKQGHLHINSDTEFVRKLVERAEPELQGSRRERHAKTLDIAQEEVLTCLGIHLFDRLYRIGQKLQAEDQTWVLLFYLGIQALRNNFEMALEKKQGKSNLELTCEEFLNEEKVKEEKRKQKQKKRKNKKNKKAADNSSKEDEADEKCECDENTNVRSVSCNSCDLLHTSTTSSCCVNPRGGGACLGECSNTCVGGRRGGCPSDCGYSSEGGDLSTPSSREGSDIACSEGICNHDGDSGMHHAGGCGSGADAYDCGNVGGGGGDEECNACASNNYQGYAPRRNNHGRWTVGGGANGNSKLSLVSSSSFSSTGVYGSGNTCDGRCGAGGAGMSTLLEMLEVEGDDCDEDEEIPAEDILQFHANKSRILVQRVALRQKLVTEFENMQQHRSSSSNSQPWCEA